MKKLISMVETVPERPHAKFLQQTPTLGMFVPCDEDGNVLKEPNHYGKSIETTRECIKQYQQAKQRVIFEGFEAYFVTESITALRYDETNNLWFYTDGQVTFNSKLVKTIEDLVPYNLTLK